MTLAMSPALPQATGADPDRVLVGRGTDHGGARRVREDDRGGAVVPVQPVRELLGADDQHVPGGARADQVRRRAHRVAEARARGVEVERGRRRYPDLVGGLGRGVGDRVGHRAAGHDHRVDVGRGEPGVLDGQLARVRGQVDELRVGIGDATGLDADPVADPLVVGVHALRRARRW